MIKSGSTDKINLGDKEVGMLIKVDLLIKNKPADKSGPGDKNLAC